MLGGLFDRGRSAIGLDVGSHALRLVQLAPRRGQAPTDPASAGSESLAVAAAADRALPADLPPTGPERTAVLGRLLSALLDKGGFSGRRVVSCLPATAVQYKNLRLPKMPPPELDQAVRWEAGQRFDGAGDPAALTFQYLDAGEVRQGEELRQEIIVMASPTAAVDEHMDLLLSCGLDPQAVDVVPGALARWAQRCVPAEGPAEASAADAPVRCVLDVGYTATKLLMLRPGRVQFFKSIDIGGRHFDRAVAEKLGTSPAEASAMRRQAEGPGGPGDPAPAGGDARRQALDRAIADSLRSVIGELVREIGLCLRYYSVTFRGRRPDKLLLVGGEAGERHLTRQLAEDSGLAVDAGSPLLRLDLSGAPQVRDRLDHSQWAVAVGLALRDYRTGAVRGRAAA